MAELSPEGNELVVHLSLAEKAEAVHGDIRVPMSSVRQVDVVDDAVHAVQCAMQDGVVEGGGMALWRVGGDLNSHCPSDPRHYVNAVIGSSCQRPLMQILLNAGREEIPEAVTRGGLGFDAATDTCKDLKVAGIIDPAKVVIEALKNAVSVAGMILTSEVMVAEVLEER